MRNNKLFYGIALMFLACVVLFLGYQISNKSSFHFGPNKVGITFNEESYLTDSILSKSITDLTSECNCDLEIIPSEESKIEFSYDKSYYTNASRFEGTKLTVDFEHKKSNFLHWDNAPGINVKIYTNQLQSIIQDGIGSIETKGVLVSDKIIIINEGVGSMDLKINANEIMINNSGVGSIFIEGNSNNTTLNNEGTGSIDAFKLLNKHAHVTNSGVGSVEVYASESFELMNEGIGSITYTGTGIIKNIISEGIGSIDKK